MKLLIDTQCWLWWFAEPDRLKEATIAQIVDETNELWFSVASVWEMGIKVKLGKLPLPEPINLYLSSRMKQLGARSLEIRALGVLLYEFLVGNPPFEAETHSATYRRISRVDLVFPSGVAIDAQDLIRKMLQKDPRMRLSLKSITTHPWVVRHKK